MRQIWIYLPALCLPWAWLMLGGHVVPRSRYLCPTQPSSHRTTDDVDEADLEVRTIYLPAPCLPWAWLMLGGMSYPARAIYALLSLVVTAQRTTSMKLIWRCVLSTCLLPACPGRGGCLGACRTSLALSMPYSAQ
jgi:hypothetical protein